MKLSTLFTISTIIWAVFGLTALFAPGTLMELYYGETGGAPGIFGSRFWAAWALGLAVLTWYARKAEESQARQAIVRGFFVVFVIGFIMSLVAQLSGVVTAFGWSGLVVYLGLAVGYGYFWFVKPGAS